MADVYLAEVPGPAGFVKQVALKLIRGEHGDSSDFVRMFIEEACLASRLSHANVVQVFEFDRIDGCYYLAMELVHGRTLRQLVDRCREAGLKLGLARSVYIAAEVAKALAYAHRAPMGQQNGGVVHRDVSPQNILVSFEGEVKLTDFGIARAMGRVGLTAPGTIKGKYAYMAPEQGRGGPIDGRADVFSLAVVLWELCCGRRLFARDTDPATLAALTGDQPVSPPSFWNETVPAELDRLVLSALERDPAARTDSAQRLATELGSVLHQLAHSPEETDLRGLMHRLWPQSAMAPSSPSRDEPTALRPAEAIGPEDATTRTAAVAAAGRRRRKLVPMAAAATVSLLVAIGWWWSQRSEQRQSTSASPGPSGESVPASAATSAVANPSPPGRLVAPLTAAPPEIPVALTPTPTPTPADRPVGRRAAPVVVVRAGIGTLRLPSPESGDGILAVNAIPWGTIHVDGTEIGHTPREMELPAGAHRVRLVHPTRGTWQRTVVVIAGKRVRVQARF
jgi:serine/threonine protein kinase